LRKELPQPGDNAVTPPLPGFTHVGQTGVIYVTQRATNLGFHYNNKEWANFGQGAPETGALPNAPDKPSTVHMGPHEYEYAPVTGIVPLRQKIADLYNKRYHLQKLPFFLFFFFFFFDSQSATEKERSLNIRSKTLRLFLEVLISLTLSPSLSPYHLLPAFYTYDCEGRAGLMRLAVAIGDVNVGYFLPEYTAYEEMLTVFKHFVPIPTSRGPKEGYKISPKDLEREILGRGLSVVALSNPCNPTGAVIEGEELKEWVDIARSNKCSLIMDEFYSHYIYTHPEDKHGRTVSCSEYIEDVNEDPIILLDGLTKNWRLPGWRVCWIVAPKKVISTIQSVGSFLEGGANHPLQVAALPLLEFDYAQQEARAIQDSFRAKRDFVVKRLNEIGMRVHDVPQATFYAWADLSGLPAGLDNGLSFFEEALKSKVILVPGIFFDINPGKRRELFSSPYHHFVRVSFGPSMDTLVQGLTALEFMIKNFKAT